MNSRSQLKRNVAIALVGGGIVGAAAGLASQPSRALPGHGAQAAAAIVEPLPVPSQAASTSRKPEAKPQPITVTAGRTVAARARDMAQRADVSSLMALRDEIVRRGEQSSQSDSPAIQRELEEVDRSLTEARQLRLKIDGEALQKSTEPREPREP